MPASLRRTALLLLAVSAAACMVSEQTGQLVPDGNPRYGDQRQSVWKAIVVRAGLSAQAR